VLVRILIAIAAGLALADASIVTLALPPILSALDTTVQGVAAVIAVYTAVLAVALIPAAALQRRVGARWVGAVGFAAFAVAGALCGTADEIGPLLVFRGLQALGAAAGLVAAFSLLGAGRAWAGAALLGAAVGPALGGALTEAFDWRAIFLFQAPVGVLAALACAASRGRGPSPVWSWPDQPAPRGVAHARALIALAALSAALTGVLFLVVLLLISGWSLEPLAAAAVVSILPLAALAGLQVRGPASVRAAAGCGLVAGGVGACAWLPGDSVGWVVAPLVVAGVGMGMGLRALAGELLPERTESDAALVLTVRHVGITLALLLLAPVTAAELDKAVERTRERGAALLLDARLPPLDKLALAGPLVSQLDPADPRDGLQRALEKGAARFADDAEESRTYAEVSERADEALVAGINEAFRAAFLICAGFALLGAVAALPANRRGVGVALGATAAALLLPVANAAAVERYAPEQVQIADPCKPRNLPGTGGIQGALQDAALAAIDRAACRFGSSREALALALADPAAAREYRKEYGVNPRSTGGILQALLGISPPG
jgi:MFS family permease